MAAVFRCYPRLLPRDERYNCHECADESCEFWADYNQEECTDDELLEMGRKYKIRVLNPDIREFFQATCERYRK